MASVTLVQLFHGLGYGRIVNYVIPNNKISADDADVLSRVNGYFVEQMVDADGAVICKLKHAASRTEGPFVVPAGGVVTRLCQIFC